MRSNLCFKNAVHDLYNEVLNFNEGTSFDITTNAQALSNRISQEFFVNYDKLLSVIFGANVLDGIINYEFFENLIKSLIGKHVPAVLGATDEEKMLYLHFETCTPLKQLIINVIAAALETNDYFDKQLGSLLLFKSYLCPEQLIYSETTLNQALQQDPMVDSLSAFVQSFNELLNNLSVAFEPFQLESYLSELLKMNLIFCHHITPVGYSYLRNLAKKVFPCWVTSNALDKLLKLISQVTSSSGSESAVRIRQMAFNALTSFTSLFRFEENIQTYVTDLVASGFRTEDVIKTTNTAFQIAFDLFMKEGDFAAITFMSSHVE